MLRADIAVPQLQRLAQAQFEHLLGVWGEWDVAVGRRIALADHLLNLLACVLQIHALGGERLCGDALALANQAEQQMFGADVVVLQGASLFLRQHDHAPCTVCKPFEHACPSTVVCPLYFTDSR